ncbi:MAG: hypothetical protein ACLGIJ_07570 [Candidatus Limnocylindria bacterium]
MRPHRSRTQLAAVLLVAWAVMACAGTAPAVTPAPVAGTASSPREVNIVAKDYLFLPDALDLVPGETVLLHVINGGLEVHEAVIGDMRVQDAWEAAEAATVGAPPGPTPVVSVPPDVAGLRIVVRSGERVDVRWTVPADAPDAPTAWLVGCHIPGHWEKGMVIPIRWVTPGAG